MNSLDAQNIIQELIIINPDTELPEYSGLAASLKPFKDVIVESRTNKMDGKMAITAATSRLAYIYFMVHFSSPFVDRYIDTTERHKAVTNNLGIDSSWEPSKKVKIAMDFMHQEFQMCQALDILNSAKKAAHAVKDFFDTVKFPSNDYKVKDVTDAVKSLADTLEGLDKLEERVKNKLKEKNKGKIKGGGTLFPLEDPSAFGTDLADY